MNVTIINTTTTDMVVSLTWSGGAEEPRFYFPYDITVTSIVFLFIECLILLTLNTEYFFIFVSILVDSYITITEFHLAGETGGIWILRGRHDG